jgi:hypothetical protein
MTIGGDLLNKASLSAAREISFTDIIVSCCSQP